MMGNILNTNSRYNRILKLNFSNKIILQNLPGKPGTPEAPVKPRSPFGPTGPVTPIPPVLPVKPGTPIQQKQNIAYIATYYATMPINT